VTDYQPTRIEEPHEVWRVTLADGRTVVAQTGFDHTPVSYVNGRIADVESVADWESGIRRASEIQQSLSLAS
jgi:hypothetical protein